MVGDDDCFIPSLVRRGDDVFHTSVHGLDGFLDGTVHSRVAHHVSVGKVHYDKVVFVLLYRSHELVFDAISAHLRLQIVGRHFGRRDENAVLTLIGSLTATVEEECHVSVFLRLGSMQLFQPLCTEILSQCVDYVFLGEEDVYPLEASVVRRHAVVLQAGNGVHPLFGHVLLGEHDSQFLGAVVAVVEKDDDVAFLDAAVDSCVDQRLHEFVRILVVFAVCVITVLHGLHHVGTRLAFAFNKKVVGHLDAVPTLVAVHGVKATDDVGDMGAVGLAMLGEVGDKTLTALRVSVAAVHEAMDERVSGHTISIGYLYEFVQVVERRVNASRRGETHEVQALSRRLCIFVSRADFWIVKNAVVGTSTVYLHQVLVDDTSGADVEMTDFGVAHLAVGQADILARSEQLRMGIVGIEAVDERRGRVVDGVALAMVADAPAVEDHQECFLSHNN